MGKFGFGSKSGDADDDSNRSGLFGRKKSSQSDQNTQRDNPYAQNSANDPYAAPMTPYQKARADVLAPRPGVGLPSGPRAGVGGPAGGPPPPYSNQQSQQSTGYGSDKYGTSSGYGTNPYANNAAAFQANRQLASNSSAWSGTSTATSSRGPGGYGGLGQPDSMSATDEKRQDLFAGAPDRYANRSTKQAESSQTGYGSSNDYGASDGYGEQRELTAEEQEEKEVSAIKNEIRQVREESVQSVDRSVQIAQQITETMRGTFAKLAVQGERLTNTEKNLDIAATHNRRAEEKTKELAYQNRSMFAVRVTNPFTSKQRAEEQDLKKLEQHRAERGEREATRRAGYQANQFAEDTFKKFEASRGQPLLVKRDAAANSSMTFEEDSDGEAEAEKKEKHINAQIAQLEVSVGEMYTGGVGIGELLSQQNGQIDRITSKVSFVASVCQCLGLKLISHVVQSDAVDDQIRMNRTKLDRAVR